MTLLNNEVPLLYMQGQKAFIKNILVCVQKINESLTGLKQQEGE